MKYKIAVFGSAAGEIDGELTSKAYEVGYYIAQRGCILLTGGCTGIPYYAVHGAHKGGGFTIGISPAANFDEHINKFKFPTEYFDTLVFTGFGKKGRNVVTVSSADAVIAISGRIGTLNELTIAYDEKRPIGILNVPGLAMEFPRLVKKGKKEGAKIIVNAEPEKLVSGLLKILDRT